MPPIPRNEELKRRSSRTRTTPLPDGHWFAGSARKHIPPPIGPLTSSRAGSRIAEAYASDPKADIRDRLVREAFYEVSKNPWWHRFPSALAKCSVSPLSVLDGWGHLAEGAYYRGFIEQVSIKAAKFLEMADEIFSLAPIRQLTITYAKGLKHDEYGLWRALLASPHLERIRALRLPVREFGSDKGDFTKLNRLTDKDIEALAKLRAPSRPPRARSRRRAADVRSLRGARREHEAAGAERSPVERF